MITITCNTISVSLNKPKLYHCVLVSLSPTKHKTKNIQIQLFQLSLLRKQDFDF